MHGLLNGLKGARAIAVAVVTIVISASLLAGCATPPPAPVSERTPPAKVAPKGVAGKPLPVTPAAKSDPATSAAVVVTPLGAQDGSASMYTVKPGDTLFSIARTNGVPLRDLAAWNNIEDPTSIRVGQQLRVTPPVSAAVAAPEGAEVRPLDRTPATGTLKTQPLAQLVPYSDQAYAQMSKSAVPVGDAKPEPKPEVPRVASEVDWTWPTEGKVIAKFNEGSNKGIVISGKRGQAVNASAAGRVIFSGTGIRGLGKLVVIRHNSTFLSVYAHNDNLLVKEGQTVRQGQRIADMGNSDADQVKLHFEIRRQGKPVDPAQLLPEAH